jgi:hypothetical protein
MNQKQLTLLIVLGVVLGGLGWVAYNKKQSPLKESTVKMGEKLLPGFPLNDVAQLTIKSRTNELNLVNAGDLWTVKERGGHPANFASVSDLLRKFWELKIVKPVKVGPSRLPQLELVAPDKGPGTLVEFKDKSGKVIKSVLLGAKPSRGGAEDDSQFGGAGASGRYIMVGSDIQTVSLVSEAFSSAEPNPENWLNKDWFKIEKHKSITVTAAQPTNNFKLTKESETATDWKLADAKPDESLDSTKSSTVTSAFGYPSFSDVAAGVKPEDSGLDKPVTAVVETFDGFTYTLKIGKAGAGDNHYFQVAVAGDFPKERAPGKDEKPEDKEKLDKEHAEKIKQLQERLKTEQAFEKWTYLVAKYTVDPFLKERKDLLAEKKEEKKDEPKKAEDQ